MPEFDTYKAIERFAKNNDDAIAVQAYKFLKHRTEAMIQWRVATEGPLDAATALNSYMGISDTSIKSRNLGDMSEMERQRLYMNACAQLNLEIDPSSFTKNV